jgi:hypothetical protein
VLSSLAVLWTIIAFVGLFRMGGGMMGCPGCPGMMSGGMTRGMRDTAMADRGMQGMMDMMSGGWMAGMMLEITLTWVVMLGLVGIFVYLIVTARRRA